MKKWKSDFNFLKPILIKPIVVLSLALFTFSSEIVAQEEPTDISGDYMSGSYRQKLADKGVMFEFVYTGEVVYNATGGIKQDYGLVHNIDMTLDMDLEKLMNWGGGQIFLYWLHGFGDSPTEIIGDAQATSNIESGMTYIKLYEAWIQQSLFDGKFSLLIGLHDLNSEFYVNDPAGLFLNSSMGIGTEIAQTGENGPSIFPTAAPAARLMIAPTENLYILAGLYNAVAGDPEDPQHTNADFTFSEGFLYIGELGYYAENDMKLAVGGWGYSKNGVDMTTGKEAPGYGVYVLADKTFAENFSVFVRAGMANENVYEVSYNIMEGLVISGALWNREDDQLGIGASTILASAPFQDLVPGIDTHETAIELTYLLQVSPWFSIQPNLQYVMNPAFNPNVDDALALALRVSLSF